MLKRRPVAPDDTGLTMPITRRQPGMRQAACALLFIASAVSATASAAQDADLLAGDVIQYAVPLAALGVTWHYDDSEGRWQLLKSYGTTVLATYALKDAFNHSSWGTRPDGGSHSFPSGHT